MKESIQNTDSHQGPAQAPVFTVARAVLILFIAGVLAYSNSFFGAFLYDDFNNIHANPSIKQLTPLWESFVAPLGTGVSGRPLANFTVAVNWAVSRNQAWSYHLLNLVIHLLAGFTLFGILRRTLESPSLKPGFGNQSVFLAMSASLLWMLHPMLTMAVTYIIQRCESGMGLFFLLTLYTAIRGWSSKKRLFWFTLSWVSFAASVGFKEVAVTAPLLVLIYEAVFLGRGFKALVSKSGILYLGYGAGFAILALLLARGGTASALAVSQVMSSKIYFFSSTQVIVHYLAQYLYPARLVFDYWWAPVASPLEALPETLFLSALFLISALAVWKRRPAGYLGFWFFLTLAPTASFFPLGNLAFEYRFYLPSAAVAVLAVLLVYRAGVALADRKGLSPVGRRRLGSAGRLAVLGMALLLGTLTFYRNFDYLTRLTLWTDTVEKEPENPRAHDNLGEALLQAGQTRKALEHFRTAVRIEPALFMARTNLGLALFRLARLDEAETELRAALKTNPNYADAHVVLGSVLARKGRMGEARERFEKAIEMNPDSASAQNAYGVALAQQGDFRRALGHFRRAAAIDPLSPVSWNNLGRSLLELGRPGEAIPCLEKALDLNPDYPAARESLEAARNMAEENRL